jgi:uncharacterized protein YvpB
LIPKFNKTLETLFKLWYNAKKEAMTKQFEVFMKNAMVAIVLLISALGFSAASDYSETLSIENSRTAEVAAYADAKTDRNRKFAGFTIDDYVKSWEDFDGELEKSAFQNKAMINVPIVNQYPEMPVGCEISAATSLINYMGFKISDTDFAKKYFPHKDEDTNYGFWYDDNDVFNGPDPSEEFVGNPFGWGYGVFPKAVAKAMNTYFINVGSTSRGYAAEKLIEEDFVRLIDGGVPVIVWATMDMDSLNYRNPGEWVTPSGEEITWYSGSHTLLLCGYDDDAFYFMDPNDKEEIVAYGRALFMTRFRETGERAVIVRY